MQNKVAIAEVRKRDFTQIMTHVDQYTSALKLANSLSDCMLVPENYKNKPQDILYALHQASNMGEDPFEFMAGTFVYKGRMSFAAKYAISIVRRRKIFESAIKYKTSNPDGDLTVTAYATLEGEVVSASVSLSQAKSAGWGASRPQFNLYDKIPEHMLHFRAASQLINRYCPDVFSGVPIVDDAQTVKVVSEVDANKAIEAELMEDDDGLSK